MKDTPSENPKIPAAYTYFGQFVSHDITLIPKNLTNKTWIAKDQSPYMDLDSVYGKSSGEATVPFFAEDKDLFLIGKNTLGEADLPRNTSSQAMIADPRNDMSIMIAQMHLMFLNLHNRLVHTLRENDFKGNIFQEARRIASWHYQWVIVHDYLKKLVGEELLYSKISRNHKAKARLSLTYLKNKKFYYLPLEFIGAAYRMGHSMIRSHYYLNKIPNARNPRTGRAESRAIQIFDYSSGYRDLKGNRSLPPYHSLQWNLFLNFGQAQRPQGSHCIDTYLAGPMRHVQDEAGNEQSMAERNLIRGQDFELPSGQSLAKEMGIEALAKLHPKQETPLWYYILQEAELQHQGQQLGLLGGNLILEVFLAKLKQDKSSYLHKTGGWSPEQEGIIPFAGKQFELKDLVSFAGMPISQTDIDKIFTNNHL
ncbi:MAG: peroxidase family protein [Bacteroidota bacterium]